MALALFDMSGKDASRLDLDMKLWCNLSDKTRRHILWDIPLCQRAARLCTAFEHSPYVCIAQDGSDVIGACWLIPVGIGAKTANVHFALEIHDLYLQQMIGVLCLQRCQLAGYESLLGIIPEPMRGARRFIESLGFREIAILPKSCWLEHFGRLVNGRLYQVKFNG